MHEKTHLKRKKAPLPPSFEGEVVGNFRLIRRIGVGGFGSVYRAEHVELGNPFAIKILHPHLSKDPDFVGRFRREALTLANLRHENVVQVVDFGEDPKVGFYLVMEWLEGKSLYRLWRRRKTFPLEQIYAIFSQLLDALEHAHRQGVVHRDLKPENLILVRGSLNRAVLKIVDFGIAAIIRGERTQVEDELAVGSPHYMAPEQIRKEYDKIGPRTDIYACGVILFELLTGERPFKGKDARELMQKHLEEHPPTLLDIPGAVTASPEFQAILDRALAKEPSERFSSAEEMFEALSQAMKNEGIEPDFQGILDPQTGQKDLLAELALAGDSILSTEEFLEERSEGYSTSETGEESPRKSYQKLAFRLAVLFVFLFIGASLALFFGSSKENRPTENSLKNVKSGDLSSREKEKTSPSRGEERDKKPQKAGKIEGKSSSKEGEKEREQKHLNRSGDKAQVSSEVPKRERSTKENNSSKKKEKIKRNKKRRRGYFRRYRRIKRQKRKRSSKLRRAIQKKSQREKLPSSPEKSAPPPKRYQLQIITEPPFAEIYVDGKLAGRTPKVLNLPANRSYLIEIKKKGYVKEKFIWRPNKDRVKKIKLVEDLF